jgi:hypothetical protein
MLSSASLINCSSSEAETRTLMGTHTPPPTSTSLGGHCLEWKENVISDTSGVIGEGGTYTAKFI